MRTFGFGFTGKDFGKIVEFKSRKVAEQCGNGLFIACSAEDIVKSAVTMDQMIHLYNKHCGKQPVALSDWETKKAAANCMIALALAKAKKVNQQVEAKVMSEQVETAKPTKSPKAPSNGRKGRNSMFDGRTFKVADGRNVNPRREGTKGHKSFAIVMGAGPKGIKYEDFLAQGGRRVDLAWDLTHDNIVVV